MMIQDGSVWVMSVKTVPRMLNNYLVSLGTFVLYRHYKTPTIQLLRQSPSL